MARLAFDPPCGFDIAATTIQDPEALARIATWGYRLVRHPGGTFFVHEAFYDADEEVLGIARPPTRLCGDSAEKIGEEVAWMQEALGEPVLNYADYGFAESPFTRYGSSVQGDGGPASPGGPFLN